MTKYPTSAGIYKLTCVSNGKVYIGKGINVNERLKAYPRCGDNIGICIKSAILKYGWESFDVEILEIFETFDKEKDHEHLLGVESNYMKVFNSTNREFGYNICSYSTDRTGIPHTEETKRKMSLSQMGKRVSDSTKEKLRQINLGTKRSDATKKKMRNSRLGYQLSEESKDKVRQARLGKTHSEESLEKMRNIKLGKKMKPLSDETKEKISRGNLGKKMSEESKEKMRQAKLGKKRSDETKEKIRQSMLNLSTPSCERCGEHGAERYRQNTQYENDESNFTTLCPGCREENDEYWAERWSEIYYA